MRIEDALEKEITRDNCKTCPRREGDICGVTEEKIGSGDEYCELKPVCPICESEKEDNSFCETCNDWKMD